MSFSFSLSARELGMRRISQIRNGMSWSKAGSGALAIITAARINGELENWVATGEVGFKWSDSHFNRTGRSVSSNDELRNKAPRHHNDYFESNKRFIEIVEDLRRD